MPRLPVILLLLAAAIVAQADEAGARRHFDSIKSNKAELVAFLGAMPKGGDLHVHTSGEIYSEDSLQEAVRLNLFYNPDTGLFQKTATDKTIPAKQLPEHATAMNRFWADASMRGFHVGGGPAHDHFFATFGIFGTAWNGSGPTDMLIPVLRRAEFEHLLYLELMMGVTPSAAWSGMMADPPDISNFDAAFSALKPKLAAFVAASKGNMDSMDADLKSQLGLHAPTMDVSDPVCFRYVTTINRNTDNRSFFIQTAANMALIAGDRRVVSMTILAPEDDPRSEKNFAEQMRIIDFLWRKMGHPNLNLHGGELTTEFATLDDMRDRIRTTITVGHTKRVGHAVALQWDYDPKSLMDLMRKNQIAVECCLSSNDLILNVKGKNHPIRAYLSHGVPVTLNTDDAGVNRSNITTEYAKAVEDQQMTYDELKAIDRNGIEYSFLPGASLYTSVEKGVVRPEFRAAIESGNLTPKAKIELAASQKMRLELKFERQMRLFEARFKG
jgi:adenosine deaminase